MTCCAARAIANDRLSARRTSQWTFILAALVPSVVWSFHVVFGSFVQPPCCCFSSFNVDDVRRRRHRM